MTDLRHQSLISVTGTRAGIMSQTVYQLGAATPPSLTQAAHRATCIAMRYVLAALACLAALPGRAAVPRLVPTRDVTVTYILTRRDRGTLDVLVNIEAGGDRLRISSQELPVALVLDRRVGKGTILLPMLKAYQDIHLGFNMTDAALRGVHFDRQGRDRVAGRLCTNWTAHARDGQAHACITDDGVILRGAAEDSHGEVGQVVATNVRYAPLSPELFIRPDGFTSQTLPLP